MDELALARLVRILLRSPRCICSDSLANASREQISAQFLITDGSLAVATEERSYERQSRVTVVRVPGGAMRFDTKNFIPDNELRFRAALRK